MEIQEKAKLVRDLCEKHQITSYEIGENTELNTAGVHRVLHGITKKPRDKTLDIILDYIENKIVGSAVPGHKNHNPNTTKTPEVQESYDPYMRPDMMLLYTTLKELGHDLKRGQTLMSEALSQTLLNTDELLDHNTAHKKSLNKLTAILSKKGITFS